MVFGALLALLAAGCSHSDESEKPEPGLARIYTPQPPAFLTGPMAVLLTNTTGFSSRIETRSEMLTDRENPSSGQLLGRGSKLLFAPEPGETADKQARIGGFSFIWDASSHSGFVVSEALQGYAPFSFGVQVTNFVVQAAASAPTSFGGHSCQPMDATMQMSDGSGAGFRVLRATDLSGFPVQVTAASNAVPLTVSFSKVRFEVVPAELFAPPDGFTKYSSPEALVDELAARRHNLRRRAPEMPLDLSDTPAATPTRQH